MGIQSLNQLDKVRTAILALRRQWLWLRHGVRMHRTSTISLSGRLVSGRRGSIVIGQDTLVAFKTLLITRDTVQGPARTIRIGDRCFVGGGAVIMPGVTIGDESIVASGAIVMSDVPARTIVAGSPARVIRENIEVGKRGRLKSADIAPGAWQR